MAADVKKVKPIDYMNVQLILCQFNLKGTRQFSHKPACCRPNHFRIATWNKAPWKGTRIPVSVKVLPVESGILGFGIRNTAQGIQNSCNNWFQNPSFTDKDWNPPESKTVLDSLTWGDTKSKLLDYTKWNKIYQLIQLTRHITNSHVLIIQTQKGQIPYWNNNKK